VSRILNWRVDLNVAEHLILITYLSSQVLVFLTVLYPGMLLLPRSAAPTFALLSAAAALSYYVWAYADFFDARRVRAGLAGLLSLVLGSAAWLAILTLLIRLLRR
jgi:TRAP-type uncharacterized transport system fused permease subunit